MRQSRNNYLFASAVIAAVCLAGCDSEVEDWSAAQDANTITAYQQYLAAHPTGAHADQAETALQPLLMEAAWQEAVTTNTAPGYAAFLERHPNSGQAPLAMARRDALALGVINVNLNLQTPPGTFMQSSPLGRVESYPQGTQLVLRLRSVIAGQDIETSINTTFREMNDGLALFEAANGTCVAVRSRAFATAAQACPGEELPVPEIGNNEETLLYAFLWRDAE